MKILSIAILGAGLLASAAVAAKQPAHRPANANQYYGRYQGPFSLPGFLSSRDFAEDQDYHYPADGLHPSPQQRRSFWHP